MDVCFTKACCYLPVKNERVTWVNVGAALCNTAERVGQGHRRLPMTGSTDDQFGALPTWDTSSSTVCQWFEHQPKTVLWKLTCCFPMHRLKQQSRPFGLPGHLSQTKSHLSENCLTLWYRYRPAKLKIGEFEIHSIALQCIYGQDWTEICSRTHFTNVTQGFQQPFACLMLERERLTQNLLGKTMLSEKKNDQYRKHGFESVSIFLWPLWPHNSHLVQLQWVVSCQVEKLSSQT